LLKKDLTAPGRLS